MRILYVSFHEVHEYDEVRLLAGLGHQVFPLGHYHEPGPYPGIMRPPLDLGPEHARLQQSFLDQGCRFQIQDATSHSHLTREFVAQFDLTIVTYNVFFIHHFWEALSVRPIVMRTNGQAMNEWEHFYADLRTKGVQVVRYGEAETEQTGYAGHDAIIRFYKDPDDFRAWTGSMPAALTFAVGFAQRYPAEYALWRASTEGLHMLLGGAANDGIPGALGPVSADEQMALLAGCRAYFYCSGLRIPYTLNFIEAWMAGIPVVVMDDRVVPRNGPRCSEIARLIKPGEDCLLVHDAAQAQAALARLIADPDEGRRIGQAGRRAAIRWFGRDHIAAEWAAFLSRFPTVTDSGECGESKAQ
jgi:glycosyltransferase involved in cell wall biosynthesis